MNTHEIKLNEEFCSSVLSGEKKFEVRLNDRNYQKGDRVRFVSVNYFGERIYHAVEKKTFEITYVLSGWGINEGYVVFAIEEVSE